MDPELHSLAGVLERIDERARLGADTPFLWPTGFGMLDDLLDGGLRGGNLILLAGPQGQGKTTMALQVARNVASAGQAVLYFCYEHDPEVMLGRLVSLEAGLRYESHAPHQDRFRHLFEDPVPTPDGLVGRLQTLPTATEAVQAVLRYQDLFHVHRSTGSTTNIKVIAEAVEQVRAATGQSPLVVVDYLQKVKAESASESERAAEVVEDLKDLAIMHQIPVLAISASDKAGLQAGKRMRAHHLRGSTALAYECDVLLILNSKYDIVSRQHLTFAANADTFRQWVVLSVEKNRNGRSGLELEFRKHFEQNRFDTHGGLVREQLVDERLVLE
ncbi:DnaB-like helicase C-terminal domain-containing protein [Nocardioides sp. CER19]|uniref:DnaB-like helicase C-terminal domain-containing protein n=1 Tax=Nocardioides sp. CER19 TaxID=3038538 RepID=UPI00244CEDF7|nr:DnaB-like helicase C-terminal domain-containing protein [Nocardioides sp. CER19]MDH2414511.1 DnaB-like helicase C-terminal domain-containing protein [Nocardioides sp. CER19]